MVCGLKKKKERKKAPCETCEFSFICSYWGLLPRRWPVRHLWGTVWKRWCRDRFFTCMDLVQRVLASHTSQQKTDESTKHIKQRKSTNFISTFINFGLRKSTIKGYCTSRFFSIHFWNVIKLQLYYSLTMGKPLIVLLLKSCITFGTF